MHVDALYIDNQHGYVWDTNTTKTVFSMHAPSTLHGALWWGAVNIVWVITHECAGHNSQHSCCLCTNSQGTPSQDQWELFFKKSFQPQYSSTAEKTIAISLPGVWPSIWWKFYNFIRKKVCGCCGRMPWLLGQGQQSWAGYCGQSIYEWSPHTMFSGCMLVHSGSLNEPLNSI